jgi:hypothetical protein
MVEPSINNCRVKGALKVKFFLNLNRATGLNHSKFVVRLKSKRFYS